MKLIEVKFNFDAEIEEGKPQFPKLQRMFNAIQKLLQAKVEYRTLDLEEKTGPLFEALVYVFNEVGEGSQNKRFFSSNVRTAAKKKIQSAQRIERAHTKVGRRSEVHDKIIRQYRNIFNNYEENQTKLLTAHANDEIQQLKNSNEGVNSEEGRRLLRNTIAKVRRNLARDIKNIPLNLKRLKDEYDSKIESASPRDLREIQANIKEIEEQPLEGERADELVSWFEAEARKLGILAPKEDEE